MSSNSAREVCHAATVHLTRGEVETAEAIIGPALAAWPRDPNVLYVAGNCALARGCDEEACDWYERSVSIAPGFVAPLLNLGFLYRKMHHLADARKVLRRCVSLAPSEAAAWLNLTSTYVNEGEPEAGEMVAREAVAHCPSNPDIRWNLGLVLLEQGKWREGWQEYFHRFDTPVLRAPKYGSPGHGPRRLRCLDDLREGQTVVCHGEQGLGDEILFAGMLADFIRDVEERQAKLVLDCHARLRTVFGRNFPVKLLSAGHPPASSSRDRSFDWVMPIGDLAGLYRVSDADFPQRGGFLTTDPGKTAAIRSVLAARACGRPVVGIAWSGGAAWTHSLYRTIPLGDLLPVLSLDACFVSLEYRDRTDELQRLAVSQDIDIVNLPDQIQASDYARTFELVSALDLVITVPTSVLHVAGAVGTPCWVVMHHKAAWRECSRDQTIPWYPQTHRRFVRGPGADWNKTVFEVARALKECLGRGMYTA